MTTQKTMRLRRKLSIVTRGEKRGRDILQALGFNETAARIVPIGEPTRGTEIEVALVIDPIDPRNEHEREWWDAVFMPRIGPGGIVLFGDGGVLERSLTPAFACDYARMWDLVRSQRSELHTQGLITNEEYGLLVDAENDKPGRGSPSRIRLESYDEQRAVREALTDKLDTANEIIRRLRVNTAAALAPSCEAHGTMVPNDEQGSGWHCAQCPAISPDTPEELHSRAETRRMLAFVLNEAASEGWSGGDYIEVMQFVERIFERHGVNMTKAEEDRLKLVL